MKKPSTLSSILIALWASMSTFPEVASAIVAPGNLPTSISNDNSATVVNSNFDNSTTNSSVDNSTSTNISTANVTTQSNQVDNSIHSSVNMENSTSIDSSISSANTAITDQSVTLSMSSSISDDSTHFAGNTGNHAPRLPVLYSGKVAINGANF